MEWLDKFKRKVYGGDNFINFSDFRYLPRWVILLIDCSILLFLSLIHIFLQIKDIGNSIQNLFFGVCVPDYWMQDMIDGDTDKRKIWAKVLESRQQKGLPYIFFTDNVNRNKPQVYKDKNLMINASNLCSEIMLPSTVEESFICCLSSMNLELYDEWKDTNAVKLAVYFLDAVLSEFIEKTEGNYYLTAARNFAKKHRALGLGVLGYHSYLQKNMIPFESFEATQFNARAFKHIHDQAMAASKELACLLYTSTQDISFFTF